MLYLACNWTKIELFPSEACWLAILSCCMLFLLFILSCPVPSFYSVLSCSFFLFCCALCRLFILLCPIPYFYFILFYPVPSFYSAGSLSLFYSVLPCSIFLLMDPRTGAVLLLWPMSVRYYLNWVSPYEKLYKRCIVFFRRVNKCLKTAPFAQLYGALSISATDTN